jgi:signal transduction histidine kinase
MPASSATHELERLRDELAELTRRHAAQERQLANGRFLGALTRELAMLAPRETDAWLSSVLARIGTVAGVDRSYVFVASRDLATIDNTHEWCAPGVAPQIDAGKGLPSSAFPWALERLSRLEAVAIPRVEDLPEAACTERLLMAAQGIRSCMLVPLAHDGHVIGFVGFDAVASERAWSDGDVSLATTLADLVASAIARQRSHARWAMLTDCLVALGADPIANVNRLTALLGELLGASTALYNRLDGTDLWCVGRWRMPPDFPARVPASGRLCHAVILGDSQEVVVLRELGSSLFAESDPSVHAYGIATCMGRVVHLGDRAVGALAVVYQRDHAPSEDDRRLLAAIANAVAVEEVRQQALDELRLREEARVQLENEMRQAQKMEAVGQLAGGVAHDFNNLLTAIVGYTDVILYELADDEPLREEVHEIRRAADRAAMLTKQLLAFSRRQVLQPKVLDLNSVLRGTEKLLRRLIGENVDVRSELSAELPSIKADPGQIEQVIVNLAVNARDAMPGGGVLTLATADVEIGVGATNAHAAPAPGRYAQLTITDTGTGMDDATLARIFEPFFTTKEHGKGTGLGLSTAYGIVRQSGGALTVESKPGVGTTFRILFRATTEGPPSTAPPPSRAAVTRAQGTVLLVEDESAVRRVLVRTLRDRGFTVLEAEDGEVALAIAAAYEGEIDVTVTDVVMPRLGGRELASRLATLRPTTRLVFMSGYAGSQPGESLPEGAIYLQKPFPPDTLLKKLRELLMA